MLLSEHLDTERNAHHVLEQKLGTNLLERCTRWGRHHSVDLPLQKQALRRYPEVGRNRSRVGLSSKRNLAVLVTPFNTYCDSGFKFESLESFERLIDSANLRIGDHSMCLSH